MKDSAYGPAIEAVELARKLKSITADEAAKILTGLHYLDYDYDESTLPILGRECSTCGDERVYIFEDDHGQKSLCLDCYGVEQSKNYRNNWCFAVTTILMKNIVDDDCKYEQDIFVQVSKKPEIILPSALIKYLNNYSIRISPSFDPHIKSDTHCISYNDDHWQTKLSDLIKELKTNKDGEND